MRAQGPDAPRRSAGTAHPTRSDRRHHARTQGPGARLGRLLLALLLTPALFAQALPGDRDQPIHITADKALRDEKVGVTVYSGNVRMSQGSMELEADELTIFQIEQDADKIVAVGAPAKMRQQPEPDESLVHAHALEITYLRTKDMVHLQDEARIEQAGDLVTGDSIDYFIGEQLIKAEAGKSAKSEQVVVVIQPSTVEEPDEAPPAVPPAPDAANAALQGGTDSDAPIDPAGATTPAVDASQAPTPESGQTTSAGQQEEDSASGATDSN